MNGVDEEGYKTLPVEDPPAVNDKEEEESSNESDNSVSSSSNDPAPVQSEASPQNDPPLHIDRVNQYLNALSIAEEVIIQEANKINWDNVDYYVTALDQMEGLAQLHKSASIGSLLIPGTGLGLSPAMYAHYEYNDIDDVIAKHKEYLGEQLSGLTTAIEEYDDLKEMLAEELASSESLLIDGTVYQKYNSAGVAAVGTLMLLNANANEFKGDFALYEITVNGEHYKYGVAKADSKSLIKEDAKYKARTSGIEHTIPEGTPKRLKQQVRHGLNLYDAVDFNFTVYKGVTKEEIKAIETTRIYGNVLGSGNTAHAVKGYTRSEKYVKDLIKASRASGFRAPRIIRR